MPDAETGDEQLSHDEFLAQYRRQAELIYKFSERQERLLVTGAAGAIFLSITFLDSIAPNPIPWTLFLLILSWAGFLVCLGSSLWSLSWTEEVHREVLDNYVAEYRGEEPDNEAVDSLSDQIDTANQVALWALLAAAVLLVGFASVNLFQQGEADGGRSEQAERVGLEWTEASAEGRQRTI